MLSAQAAVTTGLLDPDTVSHTLQRGLAGRFGGQKLLILIPDHTRTLPLPRLFATAVGDHPEISRFQGLLEVVVTDWIRDWLGYPETGGGLFTSGGSAASLDALEHVVPGIRKKDQQDRHC